MNKMQKEHIEILVGAIFLVLSFLISFFMVIDILGKSFILSILSFSFSFVGLTVGFHGIYGLIVLHRRRREKHA